MFPGSLQRAISAFDRHIIGKKQQNYCNGLKFNYRRKVSEKFRRKIQSLDLHQFY